MKTNSIIEPLESRIAPATLVDARTLTYTDVDFDLVTVKISKGAFVDPNVNPSDFTFTGIPAFGERLVLLDLSNDGTTFKGATLTITAKRTAAGGDGFVNVGFINSGGNDLASVTIAGDLGRIVAGDADTATAGLGKLTVQSMGQFGTSTQTGGNLQTVITGPLGSLVVKGNIQDAAIDVMGAGGAGKIGSVTVGGSIIGGAAVDSGSIESSGPMGTVKIGGDLRGGDGNVSGRIHALGKIASVTVGGSVVGGDAATSATGNIDGLEIGPVKIGGDLRGGTAADSGKINSLGKLASVTVGGSVIGGSGDSSGLIFSFGAMGPVKVAGNVQGGDGLTSGKIGSAATLAGVTIGGSLIGGSDTSAGSISSAGALGSVKITGDIKGGTGQVSGQVFGGQSLGSVTVGGSLIGGSADGSGQISSNNDIGAVKIGRDVQGGSAQASGFIHTVSGKIAGVTIGGSLLGGTGNNCGAIEAGDIGPVKIGRDLVGGSVSGSATAFNTGYISTSVGRIASVFIGGSIIAGTDNSTNTLDNSGAIRASKDIGSLVVKGSVIGNREGDGQVVLITAAGAASPTATSDVAIKSISIGGRVELARILAGYGTSGSGLNGSGGMNADAQIGSVTVGGDWIASGLAAGATDGGDGFGNANDAKLTGAGVKNDDDTKLVSKIASIVIKGHALGTPVSVNNTDLFGFVAQQIGSFKVGATAFPLIAGKANDTTGFLVGATSDLRVREIAL